MTEEKTETKKSETKKKEKKEVKKSETKKKEKKLVKARTFDEDLSKTFMTLEEECSIITPLDYIYY